MLKLEMMPPKTRQVFELLASGPALSQFVLVGGTALSIQIGHRLSEDLDFCLFADSLEDTNIDDLIAKMSSLHQVVLMTSASKITQAKINGVNLLEQSRDYLVDGVKVTFFARNDTAYRYFSGLEKIKDPSVAFPIMAAPSIFAMKAWLLQKRIKSRDLFDLMQFVQSGLAPFDAIFAKAREADVAIYSEELIKNVLMGVVPVDSDDEGFDSIGLRISLGQIYQYFSEQVNYFEVDQVRRPL